MKAFQSAARNRTFRRTIECMVVRSVGLPVIVLPPRPARSGRRVKIGRIFVGFASNVLDVVDLAREAGFEGVDPFDPEQVRWQGAGPSVWSVETGKYDLRLEQLQAQSGLAAQVWHVTVRGLSVALCGQQLEWAAEARSVADLEKLLPPGCCGTCRLVYRQAPAGTTADPPQRVGDADWDELLY